MFKCWASRAVTCYAGSVSVREGTTQTNQHTWISVLRRVVSVCVFVLTWTRIASWSFPPIYISTCIAICLDTFKNDHTLQHNDLRQHNLDCRIYKLHIVLPSSAINISTPWSRASCSSRWITHLDSGIVHSQGYQSISHGWYHRLLHTS